MESTVLLKYIKIRLDTNVKIIIVKNKPSNNCVGCSTMMTTLLNSLYYF